MSQPEQPESESETEPDPRVVRGLGEYLRWHALHEDEQGGSMSGPEYWQAVARGVLDGLNQHGIVVLGTEEHDALVGAGQAVTRQLDAAFGSGYQQCRDELETVLLGVPEGGAIDVASLRRALDENAGLQFETREAKIRRYNEALEFLLEPPNLAWFEEYRPDLMKRLRAAVRKMTQ
jgi:hypothetical protein